MRVGVDIVEHARIDTRIAKKILTPNELMQFGNITNENSQKEYLCSRIAAKEAIIKATNKKYTFLDIEVLRTNKEPQVNIKGISISLSHEKNISIAFCIYNEGEENE